jgi:hypothetical protein
MNLEEVTCKLACQEAIINFFGALDRKEKDLWASTITDDAKQWSPRHPGGFLEMKNHWEMVMSKKDFFPTHIVTNIVIKQTGPDTAFGSFHGTAWNVFGDAADKLPRKMLDMPSRVGRSCLGFRKVGNEWRISDFNLEGSQTYLDCGRT